MSAVPKSAVAPTADLTRRVQDGDRDAFAALMRRFNRRLFRTARAILKDDAAAEDALQDAYVAVYQHIDRFRGDADLSTWLTRVVVNQALQALRKTRRQGVVVSLDSLYDEPHAIGPTMENAAPDAPERAVMRAEIRRLVERKIDDLPDAFRIVFVLREVEEMTIEEVARCLAISEATVRTRLFRAKARLRESIASEIDVAAQDVFAFAGTRCDRIVHAVLARIADLPAVPNESTPFLKE